MTFDLLYVGAHDKAISYGAQLRESRAHCGRGKPIEELPESYLAGSNDALEFAAVTPEELEKSMN